MICSIHQPSYFPWLGLLDKIAKTETFILLDNAQLSKGTYQYRNIFLCDGKPKYLTLPIEMKFGAKFNELSFKQNDWRVDHINKIQSYYRYAPYYDELFPLLTAFYQEDYASPIDCLEASMMFLFKLLDINVKVFRSSVYDVQGTKGDMVLNLCLACGASDYLAGRGSYEYMQDYLEKFTREGVAVRWHNFNHPVYPQKTGNEFVDGLSGLDLMFYLGIENSKQLFWDNVAQTDNR